MNLGALIIGDEILSGRRQDKHLAFVISTLERRGLGLAWAHYVGDEPARIVAELRAALAAGDTVFSFGGIGATPDDHTRRCAAEALGRPLQLHSEAHRLIDERARETAAQRGEAVDLASPDHQRRLQMGWFPEGAELIPNPYNRIPGFSVGKLHFMPGFPVMAHPMLEWLLDVRLAPLLAETSPPHTHLRAARVLGVNESRLIPAFEAVEAEFPGIRIFSLPSVDSVEHGPHIEIGVKGAVEERVEQAMEALRTRALEAGAVFAQD